MTVGANKATRYGGGHVTGVVGDTGCLDASLLGLRKDAGMVGLLVKELHVAYREVAKLTSVDIKLDRTTRAALS